MKQRRITTGRVICWGTATGALAAITLSLLLWVPVSGFDANLTWSLAVTTAMIAAPIGALCALASIGAGLLTRRFVRRLPILGPVAPAIVATLAALVTGIAATAVLGYPLTGWLRVTAIAVTGLGALALGWWVLECDSERVNTGPREPAPRMSPV